MTASKLIRVEARVSKHPQISSKTNLTVYNGCVLEHFYMESNNGQRMLINRLNVFHVRSLRKLYGVSRMSRTLNTALQMWTTNHVHDALLTTTALVGTCLTNVRRMNP